MKSTVSEKGQVTLPKPLRDSLGLRAGTTIEFRERDGEFIGRRVESGGDIWDKLTGILPTGSTDDLMRELRGSGWDPALDPESLDQAK